MKLILFTIMIMLFSATLAIAIELPKNWRIPISADVHHPDNDRSKDKYQYLKVLSDFNGDKIADEAYLLINDIENKMGLFIYLSSGAESITLKLDENEKEEINNIGISLVEPGKYKTACGKGYWDCTKDEPAVLDLKKSAINYFMFESASSYWYWDKSAKSFKRVWISD